MTAYLPATNTFTYDLNGNLLSDGTRNFAYDDENQLVSVWQTNGWRSDFVYDGKMRPANPSGIHLEQALWVQTNEFRYVYDGNLVIQERGSNNLPAVTYTRGNDLSHTLQGAGGIGGLLARTDNSQLLAPNSSVQASAFYNSDGNGNITSLINASNTLVASYQYDPFGNIISQSGALADANLYRFSSKELHPASGLVYYLYRYYEPNLQRWVSGDPLGDWALAERLMPYWGKIARLHPPFSIPPAESSYGPNLHGFVHNNPESWVDYDGMLPDGPFTSPPKGYNPRNWPPPCNLQRSCMDACIIAAAAGIALSCPETGPGAAICAAIFALMADRCTDACGNLPTKSPPLTWQP